MNPVPLDDDLGRLSQEHPTIRPLIDRLRQHDLDPGSRLKHLAQIGDEAAIGAFRTLALLLKDDWQLAERIQRFAGQSCAGSAASGRGEPGAGMPLGHTLAPERWRPWEDVSRFAAQLSPAGVDRHEANVELLILEQCALACHLLGSAQVAELAAHHARATALIGKAALPEQEAFTEDKRGWLRDELLLDELLEVHRELVDEIERLRMDYLCITGGAALEMVEAAHRMTLMKYRLALNDPSLTPDELFLSLLKDLDQPAGNPLLGVFDAELRLALFDTVERLRADHEAMRRIALLRVLGQAQPASEEDVRRAARLYRKIARLIHPDALEQRPDYSTLSPANRRRLKEIWHEATATHGNRVHLSRDRLLNFETNLLAWIAEVERILRHMTFHAPSRLVEGNTLAEMHEDVRRAKAEVGRYLHAVREDIARLELHPQYAEYRRVLALDATGREDECARMRERAAQWNAEADELEARILTKVAEAARADAAQLKGKGP